MIIPERLLVTLLAAVAVVALWVSIVLSIHFNTWYVWLAYHLIVIVVYVLWGEVTDYENSTYYGVLMAVVLPYITSVAIFSMVAEDIRDWRATPPPRLKNFNWPVTEKDNDNNNAPGNR